MNRGQGLWILKHDAGSTRNRRGHRRHVSFANNFETNFERENFMQTQETTSQLTDQSLLQRMASKWRKDPKVQKEIAAEIEAEKQEAIARRERLAADFKVAVQAEREDPKLIELRRKKAQRQVELTA